MAIEYEDSSGSEGEDEESQEESQYELEKESVVFLIARVTVTEMVVLSPSDTANL